MKSLGIIIVALPFVLTSCGKFEPMGVEQSVSAAGSVAVEAPGSASAYERAAKIELAKAEPEATPGIENLFTLSPTVVSGGEPHGEAAFEALAAKGVKTILSVDGKTPDVALAAKYGMRYVHVPIRYSGIEDDEMLKIAKAFRDLEAPFFVHCFHGKHRGPAAAGVGRVILDDVSRDQAIAEMRQWCGTSKKYEGLYAAVAEQHIPTSRETGRLDWNYPSKHPFDGVRQMMIESTRVYDHLKLLSKNGWKPDPAHPDIDAVNEAEKMVDLFEKALAMKDERGRPDDYRQWMKQTVDVSRELVELARKIRAGHATVHTKQASELVSRTKAVCNACHVKYRN